MNIRSAVFVKGIVGADQALEDGKPQVAFIGRSNVGKSSVINSLTGQKELARTSAFPGRTREINLFLINKSFYLVDLPGYGFAKASRAGKELLEGLIYWYFFDSPYVQKKVVLIIDALVGPTEGDIEMLRALEERGKNIIIVANKIDKIKKAEYKKKLQGLAGLLGKHKIIPYSAEKRIGVAILTEEILKK